MKQSESPRRSRLRLCLEPLRLALVINAVGCTFDGGNPTGQQAAAVDVEPREATKPTGSQNCNPSGNEALRLSLQSEGEFATFLRNGDVIPLHVAKGIERKIAPSLKVLVISFRPQPGIILIRPTNQTACLNTGTPMITIRLIARVA